MMVMLLAGDGRLCRCCSRAALASQPSSWSTHICVCHHGSNFLFLAIAIFSLLLRLCATTGGKSMVWFAECHNHTHLLVDAEGCTCDVSLNWKQAINSHIDRQSLRCQEQP